MESKMIVTRNGDKEWWTDDGIRHRADGPAIVRANGNKLWYVRGFCHRDDGPAMEYANGNKSWYLGGICMSFNEWLEQNYELTDGGKVMYKLQYG
jgi:hypothetical protein